MEKNIKNKGQVLVVVILLITLFMVIVLVMVNLMTKEYLIQRDITSSMVAYYAAESGVEKGILAVKNVHAIPGASISSVDPQYECSFDVSPTDVNYVEINCKGTKNQIERRVLVEVPQNPSDYFWPRSWKEVSP